MRRRPDRGRAGHHRQPWLGHRAWEVAAGQWLDGSASAADMAALNTALTVIAWARPSTIAAGQANLLQCRNAAVTSYCNLYRTGSSTVFMARDVLAASTSHTLVASQRVDSWAMHVGTFDSATSTVGCRVYRGGSLIAGGTSGGLTGVLDLETARMAAAASGWLGRMLWGAVFVGVLSDADLLWFANHPEFDVRQHPQFLSGWNACHRADDMAGDVHDWHPRGHHLAATNAPVLVGDGPRYNRPWLNDSSVDFDGLNDNGLCSSYTHLADQADQTWAIWVYKRANIQVAICASDGTANNTIYLNTGAGGQAAFGGNRAGTYGGVGGAWYPAATWMHQVGRCASNQVDLWQNGARTAGPVAHAGGGFPGGGVITQLVLGDYGPAPGNEWDGRLAMGAIFDRALTDDEIVFLAANPDFDVRKMQGLHWAFNTAHADDSTAAGGYCHDWRGELMHPSAPQNLLMQNMVAGDIQGDHP